MGLPFETRTEQALWDRVTDLMIAGKVVGWFQGRMEFGARALGNRSLIADPRRTDMRDIINLRIKFREKFRPFAPSILDEEVGTWFEIDEPTPSMENVFPIRKEKREMIPAVTHVDGSGRLQTVSKRTNPSYHGLISCFFEKTGVPIVLNTSLNENEPVVRLPQEALSCFLRTDMDVLVLGPNPLAKAMAAGSAASLAPTGASQFSSIARRSIPMGLRAPRWLNQAICWAMIPGGCCFVRDTASRSLNPIEHNCRMTSAEREDSAATGSCCLF